MDVYGDNRGIIADGVPEVEEYMEEVLPDQEKREKFNEEILDIVVGDDELVQFT